MNFNGLPYSTTWLEYPDVKPTLAALGLKANSPEEYFLEYTCPTVRLEDGTCIMDSANIAPVLEQMKREPSLRLDGGPHVRVQTALRNMFGPLMPALLYKVRDGLNPRSMEYFESSRKALFGMDLDELAQSERAKNTWINAEPGIREVSAILHERPEGPYVLGDVACYADLVLASGWHCLVLLDLPTLKRLYEYDTAFERHYEACKEWFEHDG